MKVNDGENGKEKENQQRQNLFFKRIPEVDKLLAKLIKKKKKKTGLSAPGKHHSYINVSH